MQESCSKSKHEIGATNRYPNIWSDADALNCPSCSLSWLPIAVLHEIFSDVLCSCFSLFQSWCDSLLSWILFTRELCKQRSPTDNLANSISVYIAQWSCRFSLHTYCTLMFVTNCNTESSKLKRSRCRIREREREENPLGGERIIVRARRPCWDPLVEIQLLSPRESRVCAPHFLASR